MNKQMFSRSFLAASHTTQEVLEKIPGSFAAHFLGGGKTGNRKQGAREWAKSILGARKDSGGLHIMFLEAVEPEREASRCVVVWVKRQCGPSTSPPPTAPRLSSALDGNTQLTILFEKASQ